MPDDLSAKSTALNPEAVASRLPTWYPAWARDLAELYFSGTTCMFALHGNVNDLLRSSADGQPAQYVHLLDFLANQLFGSWDIVLGYDLGTGLRPLAGGSSSRLQQMMAYLTQQLGSPASWSRDPDQVLNLVEQLIQRNLLEENVEKQKRIAFLFPYAQFLIPSGDLTSLARGQAARLVRLLSWAQNPYIKRVNMAFCLIADKLAELNERLVQSPYVAALEVPMPDVTARRAFVESMNAAGTAGSQESLTPDGLTQLSSGLNLSGLNVLLSRAAREGQKLDGSQFGRLKKSMIERQCQGLVNFVEPAHNLEMVVGQQAAIRRLKQDAQWIGEGRLDAAPMGYLLCGSVGTGKTFLAECYAGSIGIPCVTLRNFRSKFVGETEGNLEQVLNVLRSLGPVVVVVDEADAALGDRDTGGDSGTSGRVFSMIASQMGDTKYRGRIIWMLLTCRPDLLPIDLKRQGRAEVHIPLFYPETTAEITEMFRVLAKKNKTQLAPDALPEISPDRQLSGADIESVVLSAKRAALAEKRDLVTRADVQSAFENFIPSAQGLEKEMQELVAVLECTDRGFLPEPWRKKIEIPNGRAALQERVLTLRQLIERA